MLERFHPAPEDTIRVPEAALRATVQAVFEKMDCPPDDAALATDALVMADLRGVETHGVSNMLRVYVAQYSDGTLNARPKPRILRETLATAAMDADRGLGIITGPRAMELAIRKARETGVGVVTARNGGHLGMLAYHAMKALEHDMVGVCMGSAKGESAILPTFGREPRLGTNPIAVAVPAKSEVPFVFDAATSAIARNKVALARRVGALMEPGWVAGPDGIPLTTPAPAPEKYYVLPLGGTREQGSHKGYGMSVMVQVMSSILSGAGFTMGARGPGAFNHYFAAYNVEAFLPADEFKESMDEFLQALRETPPIPGQERVYYGGLPEAEELVERRAHGIPLHQEVVGWFRHISHELSLPVLF
jgi:LDH2 family malate/lactate/ureidoglycolate dehydrogenase